MIPRPPEGERMLLQRIITAVVLLIVLLLVSVFLAPVYFRIFVAIASAIALWEWLRLTASANAARIIAIVYLIVAGWTAIAGFDDAAVTTAGVMPAGMPWAGGISPVAAGVATLGVLFWTIAVPLILNRADTQRTPVSVLSSLAGIIVVGGSALALAMLHLQHGVWFIFSFLGVIWCADTFAYFGGKHFGGARLAPAISPGKTRSGAICGLIAAVIWMLATMYIDGSFAGYVHQYFPAFLVLLVGAVLATYSMIGDLYESLIKRRAGIKDSSNLLPGHGGVWDRFDSILSVTPLVLALWMLIRHFH
ncbi:MAG: phosphatidate cytidylyltransferase [Advenella sp.]|uniref:Phosphatidate cytidylyltransferase n=2 Tax=Advenella TaxID=290425 RepID=A0A356LHB2_9BURK|nr:phosphatidate cytidylyltransferase [Advenella kashmirensis]